MALFASICLIIALTINDALSTQRPFYNIAHMVNSIEEIDYYLDKGANALESDISFSDNGQVESVFHGPPCDCLRRCAKQADFGEFAQYIRKVVTPGHPKYKKRLVLWYLDLKMDELPSTVKYAAGQSLARKLTKHLWNNGTIDALFNIYVQLSIAHTYDLDVVRGIRNTLTGTFDPRDLQKQIGWDININHYKLGELDLPWANGGVNNLWLNDGITNCFSHLRYNERLKQAVAERDTHSRFSKVYSWTVDFSFQLKNVLRLGVDGVITNHPERLATLIKRDREFTAKFRLANKEDSPWDAIKPSGKSNPEKSLGLADAVTTLVEVASSFWKFVLPGFQSLL